MKKIITLMLLCVAFMLASCDNDKTEPEKINVTGVTLNKVELTIANGLKATLTATVTPEDATDKAVTWSSGDKAVATVSESGEVLALKVGITDITVTTKDGGKTAVCTVTVTDSETSDVEVTGVTLNKNTLSLEIGKKETLIATVAPQDATNKNVTWNSSDKTVATVSDEGVVEALKAGATNIVVTTIDAEKTATCVVTVTETPKGSGFENEGEAGINGSSWEKAYEIKTKEQLKILSQRVVGTESAEWNTKYYKLVADIDFGANNSEVWAPIGKSGAAFMGHFDGGDHVIKGNLIAGESVEDFGIFGFADIDAEIKNMHFAGKINVAAAGILKSVGAIIGWHKGNGVIENCTNTANINAISYAGGIVGGSNSKVKVIACMNKGNISAGNKDIGGILGGGSATIIGCVNSGNINTSRYNYAGGIGAYMPVVIACWSNATSIDAGYSGAITGYAESGSNNCYWKNIDGMNGADGSLIDGGSFDGDQPTEEQIDAMNKAWGEAQPAGRENQFNTTTGAIEKI